MNHKLNKKKVAGVVILFVLIIILGIFLFKKNIKDKEMILHIF